MKLSLKERLAIPVIMPEQSKYIERLLINSVVKKVELTTDEISQFEVTQTDRGIFWNPDKAIEIDFEFTKEELAILIKSAKQTDEQEKVTNDNCDLIGKLLSITIPA